MINAEAARQLLLESKEAKRTIRELETSWHKVIVKAAEQGGASAELDIPTQLLDQAVSRLSDLGFWWKQSIHSAVEPKLNTRIKIYWN